VKKKITALKYAFVFALMVLSFPSYADGLDRFNISFGIGNFSLGGLFPITEGNNAFEFGAEVLPFRLEHEDTLLGIWFSPLNFFYVNRAGNESNGMSLINMGIYWDALSFWYDSLYLGPFASASYLFLDNGPHWNRYTFTAGLRGGLVNWELNRCHLISGETGLRIIDGNADFFLSLKVDVMALVLVGALFFTSR
jgi:hypothetical protein